MSQRTPLWLKGATEEEVAEVHAIDRALGKFDENAELLRFRRMKITNRACQRARHQMKKEAT